MLMCLLPCCARYCCCSCVLFAVDKVIEADVAIDVALCWKFAVDVAATVVLSAAAIADVCC